MSIFSKINMKKLLNNKKFAIVLSALLAFVIWLSIVVNQTQVIERTIYDVPIIFDTKNSIAEDNNLEIVNYQGDRTGSVRVSGPAHVISALSKNDFEIHIEFSNIERPGEYMLKLQAIEVNHSSKYSILSCTPSSLLVKLDRVGEKKVELADILVEADDIVAENGYRIFNKAVNASGVSHLVISGARTDIDRIKTVKAKVDLDGKVVLSKAATYPAYFAFYDENGNEIQSSLFEYNLKNPAVGISVYKIKRVKMTVNIKNAPAGINSSYTRFETLMGPADLIENSINNEVVCNVDYKNLKIDDNSFIIKISDIGLGSEILKVPEKDDQPGEEYITIKL